MQLLSSLPWILASVFSFSSVPQSQIELPIATTPVMVEMESITEKKGKKDESESGTMIWAIADELFAIHVNLGEGKSQMIIDNRQKTITTVLTDKKGEVTAMKMPQIKIGGSSLDDFEHSFKRTDETKTILGYETRKYIITSKDGSTTESWIAEISQIEWLKVAESMVGGKVAQEKLLPINKDMPHAFPLESHSYSKNGKEVTHTYVRKLLFGGDVDETLFEVPAGVQVQDMSSLMRF